MPGPGALMIVALLALGIAASAAFVIQFANRPAITAVTTFSTGLLIGISSLGALAATIEIDRREAPNMVERVCKAKVKLFC